VYYVFKEIENMTINIRGYDVLIDDEDIERILKYKWQVFKGQQRGEGYVYFVYGSGSGYGKQRGKRHDRIHLHRLIINAPKGSIVDHADGNTLNNHKSNLRICNSVESARNRGVFKNNKTGYRGVFFKKLGGINRFQTNISINGKIHNLGNYATAEAAAYIHEEVAKIVFGEYYRRPGYNVERPELLIEIMTCKARKLIDGFSIRTKNKDKRYTLGPFGTESEVVNAHFIDRMKVEIEKRNTLLRKVIGRSLL
jgi:hypothetical protein